MATYIGANGQVWETWVTHGSGTTTSTTSNIDPWSQWNVIDSTSMTTSQVVWGGWTNTTQVVSQRGATELGGLWLESHGSSRPYAPPPPPDPRKESIRKTRQHVRALRARVANRKATALLLENLDEVQSEDWRVNKRFEVTAPSGNTYRIRHGLAGNIELTHGPARRAHVSSRNPRYCCHVVAACPIEDNVLTQKLWLETREGEFLAMANPA